MWLCSGLAKDSQQLGIMNNFTGADIPGSLLFVWVGSTGDEDLACVHEPVEAGHKEGRGAVR